jgi:hypothetical protein
MLAREAGTKGLCVSIAKKDETEGENYGNYRNGGCSKETGKRVETSGADSGAGTDHGISS